MVVALTVELTCAGELMPGLEVFGNGFVEQRALRVAWVVEFGLCTRLPTRVRMRLRWACGGGHGAVPNRGAVSRAGNPLPARGLFLEDGRCRSKMLCFS